MGRQLSAILWVIGIHLLISTGYGSILRQTGSIFGEFKDAVPEIHSLSDSSALGSSFMLDLAVDADDIDGGVDPYGRRRRSTPGAATSSQVIDLESERQRFNQYFGLQVEARDGGVDLEGLSQHCDSHNVGVRSRGPALEGGINDRDGFDQHVDPRPGTSLAEVIESESGRQTGSSGAFDVVPYGRRRRSTPGAATSSQVIDLESERQRFNQHFGLQVEARDGGVDLEGLSQHCDSHNVGVRSRGPALEGGINDRDGFDQHVDLRPGTSLAEVIESESGRQTGSSGAFDAVPYGRRRRSTPGAATSSQVIDLESERQRFNQHFGLQVEARDGGVDLEGLSQHCDPHNVVRSRGLVLEGGIDGRDRLNQHVDLGPGTSLAEVIESESGRQTGSSGALVIVPYGIWSSQWAVTDSEVPDLESGRQRRSTTGAGTSSQVIDLENSRQRFSSGAPDIAPYGIWSSPWVGTDSEVPDLESGRQWRSSGTLDAFLFRWLRWSIPGAGTSSQVIDLESGRQRFSSGASDIAPYGIWSSPWAGTDSEVPDLESGRQWRASGALDAFLFRSLGWPISGAGTSSQVIDLESGRQRFSSGAPDAVHCPRPGWPTPGAGTSSQVIDLESRRESARRSNQTFIKLGFATLLGSTYAIISVSVGGDELSSRNRFISNCVLVINMVSFVSLTAANMPLSVVTPSSTPSTETHTTQTAHTILSTLGLAASAAGFILIIAMGLSDYLLWLISPAIIALVFIFVSTSLARRPGI